MKRILLILTVLIPLCSVAKTQDRTLNKSRVLTVISECKRHQGAEGLRLGRFATSAIKMAVRLASKGDSDAAEALSLMKGVNSMAILDYDDCSEAVKSSVTQRLNALFSGLEPIMEAVDEGEKTSIYALVDDKSDKMSDFIFYSPSEGSLVCLFGTISLKDLAKLVSDND